MKIAVLHEIPDSSIYCSDGDSGGWKIPCEYIKMRDKKGKKGTPIQYGLPRCTLFAQWLEKGDLGNLLKCNQCLNAIAKMKEAKIK